VFKPGQPKFGGRKKGTPNKRTLAEAEKARKSGLMPLDYMLKVMRDPSADPERRDEMAKGAAPYLHAKRAPEDKAGNTVPPMIYTIPDLEGE
jgi:hypothetical protein